MSFVRPFQDAGAGVNKEKETLYRAAWGDISSDWTTVLGGNAYLPFGATLGYNKLNWDDAEGWAPRINFHGTTNAIPFDEIAYSSTSTLAKSSKTGMISARRKDNNGWDSTVGTTGYVISQGNGRGSAGLETYTKGYHNEALDQIVVTKAEPNSWWHCSWKVRKSGGQPSYSATVRATMYIFGVNWNGSNYVYNFTGNTGVNAASSTIASPATGGTRYYSQKTCTTTWTQYSMTFQFKNDDDIDALTIRLDNDDGASGGETKVYWDNITLHPFNISLGMGPGGDNSIDESGVAAGTDFSLDAAVSTGYHADAGGA